MLSRRQFAATLASLNARSQTSVETLLAKGIATRGIPCVAAVAADSKRELFGGAAGARDGSSGPAVTIDSLFMIASMGKAFTSVAAMQLVDQGKVTLDEPIARRLPQLEKARVLEGFDSRGRPRLRGVRKAITLRHLLTHTSGLAYALWDSRIADWEKRTSPETRARVTALAFEPGTAWQYGTGIDYAGYLVEALSGMSLEQYFQRHLFQPLGMQDTSFLLPPEKLERLVTMHRRQPGGALKADERKAPAPRKTFSGGGGEYSTCRDYVKFMQMMLGKGGGILSPESVAVLSNDIAKGRRAGVLRSTNPASSSNLDVQPGHANYQTPGFITNPDAHEGGRAAGSLAWGGIANTYFWIDPAKDRCGVIMMQYYPFADKEALGLFNEFERAVYS